MAFRRRLNNHDAWKRICQENLNLLVELPGFAFANEQLFRTLMTEGTVETSSGEQAQLKSLSDQAVRDLWKFIQHKAQFDMDALLFDAFNQEVRERRARS